MGCPILQVITDRRGKRAPRFTPGELQQQRIFAHQAMQRRSEKPPHGGINQAIQHTRHYRFTPVQYSGEMPKAKKFRWQMVLNGGQADKGVDRAAGSPTK